MVDHDKAIAAAARAWINRARLESGDKTIFNSDYSALWAAVEAEEKVKAPNLLTAKEAWEIYDVPLHGGASVAMQAVLTACLERAAKVVDKALEESGYLSAEERGKYTSARAIVRRALLGDRA